MSASYSLEQQIHSLSSLSNPAFGITFTQAQGGLSGLQNYVNTVVSQSLADATIQSCIGTDWTTAWGPVVYCSNPGSDSVIADNTMILFYSPSQNLLVLGIAGTNADSMYDWFKEDFSVNTRVSWKSIVGDSVHFPLSLFTPTISGGTATGLNILLGMTDSSKTTLASALATFAGKLTSKTTLAVAGHSLGGALSPVMALYLHDMQQTSANWNSSGNISAIQAWPTAGPTPGNSAFASYYEYVINKETGDSSYGAPLAYTSKYNTLDIVPQAWEKDTLAAVPAIYETWIQQPSGSVPAEAVTGVLAVGAVLNSVDTSDVLSTFQQVSPWTSMQGTFDQTTDTGISKKLEDIGLVLPSALSSYQEYFVNFARFLAQAVYQHTTAYNTLLNIEAFAAEYAIIRQNNNPDNKSEADVRQDLVSRSLGVNLSRLDLTAVKAAAARVAEEVAAV
ncbi:lipase family protein [Chitinophagaceae bacterium MMS25-I14]